MKTQNKVGKQGYPHFPLWTSKLDICMVKNFLEGKKLAMSLEQFPLPVLSLASCETESEA